LRNHGDRGVDFQIAVRLLVVHLDVARCREYTEHLPMIVSGD
jgi:hypothetical protein